MKSASSTTFLCLLFPLPVANRRNRIAASPYHQEYLRETSLNGDIRCRVAFPESKQFKKQELAASAVKRKMATRIGDFENCCVHEERTECSSSSEGHSCDITPSQAHSCWRWPWPLAAEEARPPVPRPLSRRRHSPSRIPLFRRRRSTRPAPTTTARTLPPASAWRHAAWILPNSQFILLSHEKKI